MAGGYIVPESNPFASPIQIATNPYGPRTSFGSLGEMQQAATQAAAQQATESQAAALLRARIGQYNASQVLPRGTTPFPEGMQINLPGAPSTTMEQLAQMQAENAGRLGAFPSTGATPAQIQEFIASRTPTQQLALGAGEQPLYGPRIPVGPEGAFSSANPIGQAAQTGAPLAEEAAAASPGLLAQGVGAVRGLPGALGEVGLTRPTMGGAMQGLGYAIGGQLAGAAADKVGAPSFLGDALRTTGTTAGLGRAFGPEGALAGAAFGASYSLTTSALHALFPSWGDDGSAKLLKTNQDGVQSLLKTAQAVGKKLDPNTQAQLTNALSQAAAIADPDKRFDAVYQVVHEANGLTKSQSASPGSTNLALQMGQAMGALSQDYVNQAAGQAATIRGMESSLPAQYAPMLEADAASREAYAKQMGNAYQAAAYISPTIQQMDAQIAYQQQLLQQIRAAQTSGSGGSGSLSSALAGGVSNAQNAQANANYNTNAFQQAQAYAGG